MRTMKSGGCAPARILAGLALLLSVPAARAASGSTPVEFDVPFEFLVGTAALPAGSYVVELANPDEGDALVLRNLGDGNRFLFVTRELPRRPDPPGHELVFEKAEGKYYLREVWGLEFSGRELTANNAVLTRKAGEGPDREVARIPGRPSGGRRAPKS